MRPPIKGDMSPWGAIQHTRETAEGLVFVSTAGHGGYWVSDERKAAMPAVLRELKPWCGHGNWYEEDCDWAIVALSFPEVFQGYTRYAAIVTARRHWDDAYEDYAATEQGKADVAFVDAYLKEHGKSFQRSCCSTSGGNWHNSAVSLDDSERIEFETADYFDMAEPFTKEQLTAAGITWSHPKPIPSHGPLATLGTRPFGQPGYCSNDYEDSFSDADPGL